MPLMVPAIPDAPSNGSQYVRRSAAWQRTFITPGYVAQSWYPPDFGLQMAAGASSTASTIFLTPMVVYNDITVDALMAAVTTLVAASNFQLALYAMDPVTKLPTGNALTSTANMSGAAVTQVTSTLTTPIALAAGMYWAAVNQDGAIVFLQTSSSQGFAIGYLGDPTPANVAVASPRLILQVAQTFGTWPDLTAASFTRLTSNSRGAAVFFKPSVV